MTRTPKELLWAFIKSDKTSYLDQLKDERWRERSAQVRSLHRNHCQVCGNADTKTEVHHKFYDWNRKLWEYSNEELTLLCVGCHDEIHVQINRLRRHVIGSLRPDQFKKIVDALQVATDNYHPSIFADALLEFVCDPRSVQRFAKAWSVPVTGIPDPDAKEIMERSKARMTVIDSI